MVIDPKRLKKEKDDDDNELLECNFCHNLAQVNLGAREKRI
jgi:hypothetical protein